MAFISQAVTVLQTLVIALGAGLAVWGVINLMEGYGHEAVYGWRRCCADRHHPRPDAVYPVLIRQEPITTGGR